MMKFKKFLAATMTGAMMLGVVAAAAPTVAVYADEPTEGEVKSNVEVKIDYATYSAVIKTEDNFIFLDVLKKSSNGYKISNTYTYETDEGKLTVDLSFLKATAEQYIRVYSLSDLTAGIVDKTEVKDAEVETIVKQSTKFTMKYKYVGKDTWYQNLSIKIGSTTTTPEKPEELAEYEYRTLYGKEWASLADADDSMLNAGTTLVVRKVETEAEAEDGVQGQSEDKEQSAPTSAEVKVKITAKAKAPKITVDYVKATAKVTDKQEYAYVYEGEYLKLDTDKDNNPITWLSGDKSGIKLEEVKGTDGESDEYSLTKDGGYLVVRTSETGSKAASNMSFVSLPEPKELAAPANNAVVDGNNKLEYEYDQASSGIKLTPSAASVFQYRKSEDDDWVTLKKAVIVENTLAVQIRSVGKKGETLPSLPVDISVTAPAEDNGDDQEES